MEITRNQIQVQAETAMLSSLREQVFQICSAEGVPAHDSRLMVLAVDEAVSNIIEHASLEDGQKQIWVTLESDSEKLSAEICDSGKPFDPTPRRAEPNRGLFPKRGFGLYLIQKIIDEIEYTRTSDGKNKLRLTKSIG